MVMLSTSFQEFASKFGKSLVVAVVFIWFWIIPFCFGVQKYGISFSIHVKASSGGNLHGAAMYMLWNSFWRMWEFVRNSQSRNQSSLGFVKVWLANETMLMHGLKFFCRSKKCGLGLFENLKIESIFSARQSVITQQGSCYQNSMWRRVWSEFVKSSSLFSFDSEFILFHFDFGIM